MWLGKNESFSFWLGVLTDLKARAVEDILITATDNLNGFTQTIKNEFAQSQTQICVVHQIRNSARYVVWKDKKKFSKDIKQIYDAPAKQAVRACLKILLINGIVNNICCKIIERQFGRAYCIL